MVRLGLKDTDLDYNEKTAGFDGTFNVDADSTLRVKDNTFDKKLTGKGTLTLNAEGKEGDITLGNNVKEFEGTFNLQNGEFILDEKYKDRGSETNTLSKGTLKVGAGSNVKYKEGFNGDSNIGGVAFGGGTLVFTNGVYQEGAQLKSQNEMYVDTLDLRDTTGGTVRVEKMPDTLDDTVKNGLSLIELNIGDPQLQLVDAQKVNGNLTSNLELEMTDKDGKPLANKGTTQKLTNSGVSTGDNGKVVAEGTFDYGLTTSQKNDGLYVSYQLQKLAILDGSTVVLEGVQGKNNTFKADISEKKDHAAGSIEIRNNTKDGVVTLSGNNSYHGATTVASGGLKVAGDQALGNTSYLTVKNGANFNLNGTTQTVGGMMVEKGGLFFGTGHLNGTKGAIFNNAGTIEVGMNGTSAQARGMQATGTEDLYLGASLRNSGDIRLAGNVVGNTLTIDGDYTGSGDATLYMNANINGVGKSIADKLVIRGKADGATQVNVNTSGVGGKLGDKDLMLIETVESTDDAFKAANTITLGSYEYFLTKGKDDQNWYLSGDLATEDPNKPEDQNTQPAKGKYFRSDIGVNIANTKAAVHTQIPGLGGVGLGGNEVSASGIRSLGLNTSKVNGEFMPDSSIWNITRGGKNKGRTGEGQVNYDNDYFSTTIGGDHLFDLGMDGTARLGLMITTMKAKTHANNQFLEIMSNGKEKRESKGRVTGQAFGIYGTWYLENDNPLTPYIDGLISYGTYRNKVESHGNPTSSYRSHLWNVTLQGGYPIDLGNNVVIEPQAQLTYLNFSAKRYQDESSGVWVKNSISGNTAGRVGLFVYPKEGDIKPYAGINLWYDGTKAVTQFDNDKFDGLRDGFSVELKAGVTGVIAEDLTMTLDTFYRKGKHKSKDYGAGMTIKYRIPQKAID